MQDILARNTHRFGTSGWETRPDQVVTEAPLTIRLRYYQHQQQVEETLAVTLRTPGQDDELAMGLLLAEGIIGQTAQVVAMVQPVADTLTVQLAGGVAVDLDRLSRRFMATASCGLCGKATAEGLGALPCYFPHPHLPQITPSVILQLGEQLRAAQPAFAATGGIHGAGLFSATGELLLVREDIGRHNALDKLFGAALRQGLVPVRESIVLLSGRIGYELVQKASMVGLPVLAAVGAPSSLAIELAEECGMTLIGFLRSDRFNVYAGKERLV